MLRLRQRSKSESVSESKLVTDTMLSLLVAVTEDPTVGFPFEAENTNQYQ